MVAGNVLEVKWYFLFRGEIFYTVRVGKIKIFHTTINCKGVVEEVIHCPLFVLYQVNLLVSELP